jgi:Ca2+-binding RTX toxin-like protein
MPLQRIGAPPQKFFLSFSGLHGAALEPAHLGLLEATVSGIGLSSNGSGSSSIPGYSSELLTLNFDTDQGLTWFLGKALTGTNIAGTLFGGGIYGLQESYLDSLTLSLTAARIESVVDYATGGFVVSIVFSTFDFQARDLQGNGLLAAASRFGSTNTGTDTTLTASSATSTAPVGHTGVPTHFYFMANGLAGPISGGGLSNLFAANVSNMSVYKSGVANPTVSSLTVTLYDGEEAIDGILSMLASHANISLAQVLGYSADGQVYKLSINSAHINAVDLSKPGQVTLTLDFTAATWRTIDVDDAGNPMRFDDATANLNTHVYNSSGGSIASVPADFTPPQSSAVGTPDRYFVSVGGWQGDTASGLHTGLFEAASVNLGTLQNSGSSTTADFVTLTFSTQDAAARFFDAMAGNATLPSVSIYESVSGTLGLSDAFQFDMANAKISSVSTAGGRTVVTMSYAAFEATAFARDAAGNAVAPVHYGATLSTGASTTVTDAPASNAAPTSHADAPIAYYISIPGITGNYPLQFQNAGTVSSLAVDFFTFGGQRPSSGAMQVGDVTVELSDGMIYLPKLAGWAASGINLTGVKIFGYSALGLTYELDLTGVKFSAVVPHDDGTVQFSLTPNQYAIHVFDRGAGAQALIDETSGYNKTGAVVSHYAEIAPADQSAFVAMQPAVTLATPEHYYFTLGGWIGDSDSALHSGLFEITSPDLLSVFNNSGTGSNRPTFTDLTVRFASLDGLANFAGALASNTHYAKAGIIESGFFGGPTERDSFRLGLENVSITSVSVDADGYSATIAYGSYYLDTKGINASGVLAGVVSSDGYDVAGNQRGGFPLSSALNTQPTDGSNNGMPTSYFLQMTGISGTFSTADTAGLLPIMSYSVGFARTGTLVTGGSVSLIFNSSSGADAEFLRLMTDATFVSQAHILGYNSAGQVFDLSLASLHVASVQPDSYGTTAISLQPGSFSIKTVDLGTGDAPVRSQTAGYDFAAGTATAFAQTTITAIPVAAGALDNAPISLPDNYAIDGSGSIGTAAGVLANDSDPDGHALLAPLVTSTPAHGTVTLRSDGSFDYVAAPGFSGYDSFLYRVADVFGLQGAQTTVSLTVYLAGATAGDDIIVGTPSSDLMRGLGGDDNLSGGGGTDTLIGGTGNDTYGVYSADDVVIENANEGIDVVKAVVNYSIASQFNIELLRLSGPGNINATGNTDAQKLVGNSGDNVLDGGGGGDVLRGGAGNDTYIVRDATDRIVESDGNGNDIVQAAVSYTLAADASVETLRTIDAAATAAINLTGNDHTLVIQGNAGANFLTGGAGNETISGFAGNDTLFGGAGADRFVFGHGTGQDSVGDFVSGSDKLDLSAFGFASFAAVQAATHDVGGSAVIDLGGGDSVTLSGFLAAQLQSGDVILGSGQAPLKGYSIDLPHWIGVKQVGYTPHGSGAFHLPNYDDPVSVLAYEYVL